MDECGAWDARSWWSMWDVYVFGSGRREWRVGEWMRGLGLAFTNPVGTGGVLDVCLCFGCGRVGGMGGEWVWAWTRVWMGGMVLCLCEVRVWISCVDDRSRYLCIVLGGYRRICSLLLHLMDICFLTCICL